MKWATNIGRKELISLGVCLGKFTKKKRFQLQVTALDVIAKYARVCYFKQISYTSVILLCLSEHG